MFLSPKGMAALDRSGGASSGGSIGLQSSTRNGRHYGTASETRFISFMIVCGGDAV